MWAARIKQSRALLVSQASHSTLPFLWLGHALAWIALDPFCFNAIAQAGRECREIAIDGRACAQTSFSLIVQLRVTRRGSSETGSRFAQELVAFLVDSR